MSKFQSHIYKRRIPFSSQAMWSSDPSCLSFRSRFKNHLCKNNQVNQTIKINKWFFIQLLFCKLNRDLTNGRLRLLNHIEGWSHKRFPLLLYQKGSLCISFPYIYSHTHLVLDWNREISRIVSVSKKGTCKWHTKLY